MRRFYAFTAILLLFPLSTFAVTSKSKPLPELTHPPFIDSNCEGRKPGEPYCAYEHFECNRGVPVDGIYTCSDFNDDGRIDFQDCIDAIYAICERYGGVHSYG